MSEQTYVQLAALGLQAVMVTLDEELREIRGWLETERSYGEKAGLEQRRDDLNLQRSRIVAAKAVLE